MAKIKEEIRKEEIRYKERKQFILEGFRRIFKNSKLDLVDVKDKLDQVKGIDAYLKHDDFTKNIEFKHGTDNKDYVTLEVLNIQTNPQKECPYIKDFGWSTDTKKISDYICFSYEEYFILVDKQDLEKYVKENYFNLLHGSRSNTTHFKSTDSKQRSFYKNIPIDELLEKIGGAIYYYKDKSAYKYKKKSLRTSINS